MSKLQYKIITIKKQYDKYCSILKDLLFGESTINNKEDHIELLSLLIKTWDEEQFDGEEYDPVELLKSLMDDHNLKQKDIAKICDVNKSFVSEVMNYKKYISKKMVRILADHFKINQEAFNKPYKIENSVFYIQKEAQLFVRADKTHLAAETYPIDKRCPDYANNIINSDDNIILIKYNIEGSC